MGVGFKQEGGSDHPHNGWGQDKNESVDLLKGKVDNVVRWSFLENGGKRGSRGKEGKEMKAGVRTTLF